GMPGVGGGFSGPAGTTISAINRPYSWEEVAAELQSDLQELFGNPTELNSVKLMVSVYDYDRWTASRAASDLSFNGNEVKLYEEGGSRVVYRGWNVEIK
ncbi:MAG: hypothetical protein H7Z75_11685, partial [Ferruginibacter sp.]|nr:hypothetical protein [Cytophagales bacterium]